MIVRADPSTSSGRAFYEDKDRTMKGIASKIALRNHQWYTDIMNKPLISLPTVYPSEIAHKGEEIYQKISKQVEKEHSGDFVAIEVESGKYFLGQTQIEAIEKAKKNSQQRFFTWWKSVFLQP